MRAAKLPTVAVSAPSTPCSAQVSQSSVSKAGLVRLPAAEERDLTLELDRRRRDERYLQPRQRIGNDQPRREIVAAVNDEIVTCKERVGVVGG